MHKTKIMGVLGIVRNRDRNRIEEELKDEWAPGEQRTRNQKRRDMGEKGLDEGKKKRRGKEMY